MPEIFKRRCPSSFTSATVARIVEGLLLASWRMIWVPMRAFFPGRSMAHQSFKAFSSSNNISNLPPVFALVPRNRAGITRELFKTRTSPSRKNSGKSLNFRCSIRPSGRCKTSSRDPSRLDAGCCAINSGGRVKLKSAVRTGRVSSFKPEVSSRQGDNLRPDSEDFQTVNNFPINISFPTRFPLTCVG